MASSFVITPQLRFSSSCCRRGLRRGVGCKSGSAMTPFSLRGRSEAIVWLARQDSRGGSSCFFRNRKPWTTTPELDRLQASPVNLQFYCWKYFMLILHTDKIQPRVGMPTRGWDFIVLRHAFPFLVWRLWRLQRSGIRLGISGFLVVRKGSRGHDVNISSSGGW